MTTGYLLSRDAYFIDFNTGVVVVGLTLAALSMTLLLSGAAWSISLAVTNAAGEIAHEATLTFTVELSGG